MYIKDMHIISLSSYNGHKLNSLLTCFQKGFIAQLLEHCTTCESGFICFEFWSQHSAFLFLRCSLCSNKLIMDWSSETANKIPQIRVDERVKSDRKPKQGGANCLPAKVFLCVCERWNSQRTQRILRNTYNYISLFSRNSGPYFIPLCSSCGHI